MCGICLQVTYITTFSRVKPAERLTVIDIGTGDNDAAGAYSLLYMQIISILRKHP